MCAGVLHFAEMKIQAEYGTKIDAERKPNLNQTKPNELNPIRSNPIERMLPYE